MAEPNQQTTNVQNPSAPSPEPAPVPPVMPTVEKIPEAKPAFSASQPPASTDPLPAPAAPVAPPVAAAKTVKTTKGRPESGRGKEVLTCTTAALALVAAFFVFVSVTNSKTGFLDIPWLVAKYVPDPPARRVEYRPMDWQDLNDYVAREANRENLDHGPPFEVPLTEIQMTGLLTDSLVYGLRDRSMEIRLVQMAVLPDRIEILVRLTWRKIINLDLAGRLVPEVEENGDLHFDVTQAKLGHMDLPVKWLWPILSYVFTRDLGNWQIKAGDFRLGAIQETDGQILMIFGSPTSTQP